MDRSRFRDVIAGAREADRRSLGELYASYNPMLVRFMQAQAPGYDEDLAQDTWLAVAGDLHRFDGDERAFRMALFAEARDQIEGFRKSAHRRAARPVPPHSLDSLRTVTVGDALVADAGLAEKLEGLKPLHAEILLLRVVAGFTAEETGALLGKSPVQIRVTQHRVLRQLARRLDQPSSAR
ncbi:MAG: sigma-70 family RNA polymerase sigma factor [Actinomycetota bacterium]|nr:sigma-70 family RNA polymerase sigma factor [Actinomycetota bacterium]